MCQSNEHHQVAAVLAFPLKEITDETYIGVAREYYGDKSEGSPVASYCFFKKQKLLLPLGQ
jgi:hypothetical protein